MIGQTLSHFEISSKLGEGGMGEVYRATDTKLGREVAIKVLPKAFVASPERLTRFEREARLLASLNHSNIASLHEVREENGVHFLVMELAAGETLAERIARGAVPVDEAIPIALQIACAIEAAHEQGIVHRDLKPANVKVSESGEVKVLDFGLAKALGTEPEPTMGGDVTHSPTLTYQPTVAGVLLGTAAYMSPEQARGRTVDKRTDIWAFGVVLWEMLTGRRLFKGESVSDTLAAVLRQEPPSGVLPADLPNHIERLLDRCLERDPTLRLRDIGEARIALATEPETVDVQDLRRGFGWPVLIVSVLAGALLVGALAWVARPAPDTDPAPSTVSFSFDLPEGHQLMQTSPTQVPLRVAPDGSFVVFSARPRDGDPQIFRRVVDSEMIDPVEGGEGGMQPFVSPDSRWIGFFSREGGLEKVAAEGGLPERIYGGARLMATGGFWGLDDRIYFARGLTGGIAAVPAAGGEPEQLTIPEADEGEIGHWYPRLLPGENHLLYAIWSVDGWRHRILELSTGELRDLEVNGWHLHYLDTNHLVWLEYSDLYVAPFDPEGIRPLEKGRPVLSGVASFHVSPRGTLAYVTRAQVILAGTLARWSESDGVVTLEDLGRTGQFRVSPDGRRLVVAQLHLQFVDVDRGVRSPLTTEGVVNNFPVFSPDGTRVAFNSLRFPHGLYVRSADGLGEAQLVLARSSAEVFLPSSWAPDGRSVVVTELHPDGQADVVSIDLETGARTPLIATEAVEHSGAISPDGRWLAYTSDVSGREEIYLRPYPEEGGRTTVSTSGGTEPRWTSDGRTLLFRDRSTIFTVEVGIRDETLDLGVLRPLAKLPSLLEWTVLPFAPVWDIAPDGDLYYLQLPSVPPESNAIHVVLNWSTELALPGG